jgi:NhaP-type Na+/H+ or K+/H+ antiporter
MPLTFAGIALAARGLAGLDWTSSLLVGAVLAPTDPVFASAIVTRTDVPARLRQLLNIESGLNDGLALPLVLVLLATAGATRAGPFGGAGSVPAVLGELAAGLALGVAAPLAAVGLARLPGLGAEPRLQPLGPVAIGIVLYAACQLTHANAYLAAFAAGSTLATAAPEAHRRFAELGELLAELGKFAALLVFGALLTPPLFGRLSPGGYAVAVLALLVVRPVALAVSLVGSPLGRRERAAAAWFGPKGFASVVYGLLVVEAGIPEGQQVFDLVAVCIALSIVAHSSTDVPVARLFAVQELAGIGNEHEAKAGHGTGTNDVADVRVDIGSDRGDADRDHGDARGPTERGASG